MYEFAASRYVNSIDLHYQLAMAYLDSDQPGKAAEELKRVIHLDPYYKNSHLQLGVAYYQHDYKTPAFFSLMTFLLLEPDSERSGFVVGLIDDIFRSGVTTNKVTKEISLDVNPESKIDEGDFRFIDIVMSTRRVDMLSAGNKAEMSVKLEQLKSYLLASSQIEYDNKNEYFIVRHYLPFYHSLYQAGLDEALLYHTHQTLPDKNIKKWLGANKAKLEQLGNRFKQFKW